MATGEFDPRAAAREQREVLRQQWEDKEEMRSEFQAQIDDLAARIERLERLTGHYEKEQEYDKL